MTKQQQNVELWAGDDKVLRFSITGSDGNSQNMSGNTASWILQDEVDSSCILVARPGIINGSLIDVIISGANDTKNLNGWYYHELAATASGSAVTLAVGLIKINKSSI